MASNVKTSWLKIHRAIHDGSDSAVIDGKPIPVQTSPNNGCRFVAYHDTLLGPVTIMEQNKKKHSSYAERAKAGEQLSWVIPSNGTSWILIETKPEALSAEG